MATSTRTPVGIRTYLTIEASEASQLDGNTLMRVYALHELHRLRQRKLTRGALVDYRTRYRLVLLAHSQPECRELGPFVATIHEWRDLDAFFTEYRLRLTHLLLNPAARRNHTNILMHVQGYSRSQLDLRQRQELTPTIGDYRREARPLLAPLVLLKHYMAEHPSTWLSGQRYFKLWSTIWRLQSNDYFYQGML